MKNKFIQIFKVSILPIFFLIIYLSPIRKFFLDPNFFDKLNKILNNPLAPLIYGLLYVLGVVFAVPGLPLTVFSGVFFGFWTGSIIVIIASNIGISLTFIISRYLGNSFFQKWSTKFNYIDSLDKKLYTNGFKVMFLLRIIPIVPFNALNYTAGLTKISMKNYSLASFLGMMPASMLYVYFGASAIEIKNNPFGIILSISLLILFTIISLFIKKYSELKELNNKDTL